MTVIEPTPDELTLLVQVGESAESVLADLILITQVQAPALVGAAVALRERAVTIAEALRQQAAQGYVAFLPALGEDGPELGLGI